MSLLPDRHHSEDEPFEALCEGRALPEPPLAAWGALFDFFGGTAFCPVEAEIAAMWMVQQVPTALRALQHFSQLSTMCGLPELRCDQVMATVQAVERLRACESVATKEELLNILGVSDFEAQVFATRIVTLARALHEREIDPARQKALQRVEKHLGLVRHVPPRQAPEGPPEPSDDVNRIRASSSLPLPSASALARLVVMADDEAGDEPLEALLALVGRTQDANRQYAPRDGLAADLADRPA